MGERSDQSSGVNNLHHIAKVRVVVVRARRSVHVVKRSLMFFVTMGGILCQLGIRITHGRLYV